jgi:hypothetical protein
MNHHVTDNTVLAAARYMFDHRPNPGELQIMFDLYRDGKHLAVLIPTIGDEPYPDAIRALFAAGTLARAWRADTFYVVGEAAATTVDPDGVEADDVVSVARWAPGEPPAAVTAPIDDNRRLGEWGDWTDVESGSLEEVMARAYELDPPFTPGEILDALAATGWAIMTDRHGRESL